MPSGGHNKKTVAELKMTGRYREDRHGDRNEPRPKGEPRKPDWLTGVASDLWDRIVPDLVEAKVATSWDQAALEILCRSYAEWRAADRLLRETEDISERYKCMVMCTSAGKQLDRYLAKFGLTPVDRRKIDVPPDEEGTSFSRLLG